MLDDLAALLAELEWGVILYVATNSGNSAITLV